MVQLPDHGLVVCTIRHDGVFAKLELEVRYWTIPSSNPRFRDKIGPTRISVERLLVAQRPN
jgi:hypothetical protein